MEGEARLLVADTDQGAMVIWLIVAHLILGAGFALYVAATSPRKVRPAVLAVLGLFWEIWLIAIIGWAFWRAKD